MKKFYTLLSSLIALTLSINLTAQTCSDGAYQWTDVVTIFENNGCSSVSCHGGGASGLDLTTYVGFAEGGNKCGTQIFDGTTLVDIIKTGTTCEMTSDDDGGALAAMEIFTGSTVSQADVDAIQAYIDAGAFEFCRGTPSDDGFDQCATTIGSLSEPAETSVCTDGSNPTTLALPTGSLPNVQVVVEVNGTLITVSDDGSFDYSILNAGDEVCYTAFNYDLDAIQKLLVTASGLCPTLDLLFPDLMPCAPIDALLNGDNDGSPGLNDLLEVLDFAASLSSPITSVQSATSVLQALNGTITPLNLGPICYATSNNVCLLAEECVASTCPVVYLNDDNLPDLPDVLCEGDLLSLCFDLLVDEATFDPQLVEFNYNLTFNENPVTLALQNSFSSGTQIDANANGQICFEATIPAGPDACQSFDVSLEIVSVFYRDDITCPSNNVGFALNLSALPASEGDDLNSLVPLLALAGFNPLNLTAFPNPNWTATVVQAPACDGTTLGIVELYAADGTLCDTVSDLGTAGADGECPANNAEFPEYTYFAFETFTVLDQNEMDSIIVNPCAIEIIVPAQTTNCVENCGPCVGDEVEVTFSVDMSCSGTDMRPPVVTGPFNGFSGDGNVMIDPDGDDVWEAVICIVPGTAFEYKYAILNFAEQEDLVDDAIAGASCTPITDFNSFANRQVTIDAGGALPTDTYGICGSCESPPVNVTFSVDMSCSGIAAGTEVAMFGGFNGFCCPLAMENPDGDNIWTRTLPFPPDDSGCISMQYLYMSPDLNNVESFLTTLSAAEIEECSTLFSDNYSFANRIVEVCADVVLNDHWQSCSAVAEPAGGCDDGDCTNGTETWDGCACISGDPTGVLGCTDPAFCEYNPDADCDDGSCSTSNADPGTCNTDCTAGDTQVWDATTCSCVTDVVTVLGCNNSAACNFNPDANCDDGSCDLGNTACADPCNEPDPDDGCDLTTDSFDAATCTVTNEPNCDTGTTFNASTCMCDTDVIMGCTDACAANYDPTANADDGSCEPYDMTCNDDCTAGAFGGTWDAATCACINETEPVNGCTDSNACNFNPDANCDDGSCDLGNTACADPCNEPDLDDGCDLTTDSFDEATCAVVNTANCPDGTTFNSATCFCDEDFIEVLGCTNSDACNYNPNANTDDDTCVLVDGGTISTTENTTICAGDGVADPINVTTTGSGNNYTYIVTDETGTLILAGPTTDTTFDLDGAGPGNCLIWGIAYDDINIPDDQVGNISGCFSLSNSITVIRQAAGCTDSNAINYDSQAECDDNSCQFDTTVEGCTDPCAPNYNVEATTDDGSCQDYDMTCPEDTCLEMYNWNPETCECDMAVLDAPDCNDGDDCTNDSYDTMICECVNELIPDCGQPACPTPGVIEDCGFELSQQRLDAIATLAASETGGDFPHGGMGLTADQTIRDIFTSDGNVGNEIKPGFVVAKHTYAVDDAGNKGDLLATFVMVKRAEGYWNDSNDWEYIMMPVDPTVDYTINPNGILANAAVSGNVHDMNPGCVGCHNGAGGGDQLFSND